MGHLLSTFGTDVEIAALWAAVVGEERIRVGGPDLPLQTVSFGEKPRVHRGTLTVPGRKRPVRHLVVVSSVLNGQGDNGRFILKEASPDLILQGAARLSRAAPAAGLERVVP